MDRSLAAFTAAGGLALGGLAAMDVRASPAALAAALAGWLCYAGIVRFAVARASLAGFGWANRVTLLRGLIVALLMPFQIEPAGWLPVGLGALALSLDGVDGPIARRTGSANPFGARFDMETDALTVLVLSALVAAEGRTGAWVLLSGALRYLYVGAGWVWPWLRRPPPPSFARKLVCVIQIAALLTALVPILAPPWPSRIAAVALSLLLWSFGRDVIWLLRERDMAESPEAPYLSETGGV